MERLASCLYNLLNQLNRRQEEEIDWHRIIEGIPAVIPCDGGAIRFYNPITNKLSIIASFGLPREYLKRLREVEMPEVGWTIIKEGGPLIPKDYRIHPAYQAWKREFERIGIKTNVVVGIFIDGKFLGFLSLVRKKDLPFKRSEIKIIRIIAGIIAKGLSRFYHLRIEASLYDFFHRIRARYGYRRFFRDVLAMIVRCFNVNGAGIFILEQKLLKPLSILGDTLYTQPKSILDLPELLENIDVRNAFLLDPERSEQLCRSGNRLAVAPLLLHQDHRGFLILCFPKYYLLTNDDLALLHIWSSAISSYFATIHTLRRVERERGRMVRFTDDLLRSLATGMELRTPHFRNHASDVARYSVNFARRLGWNESRINRLRTAALLHDIGKIVIPDQILNKPTRLSEWEWRMVKRHPIVGTEIIEGVSGIKSILPIIRHHHENYDGTGYPDGLRGRKIPTESRLLAIVDTYQALISSRPYRPAHTKREARRIIEEQSGSRFDPQLTRFFLDNLNHITR